MKKLLSFSLLLFSFLFIPGCFLLPAEEQLPKLPLVTGYQNDSLRTEIVRRGDLLLVETIDCHFVPANETKILSNISGEQKIGAVYCAIGDEVSAGDLLLEFAVPDLDAAIETLEADLYKLRRNLDYYNDNLSIILNAPELSYRENGVKQMISSVENDIYISELRIAELYAQREATRIYAEINGTVTYLTTRESVIQSTLIVTVTDKVSGEMYCDVENPEWFPIGSESEIRIEEMDYTAKAIRRESTKSGTTRVYFSLNAAEAVAIQGTKGQIKLVLDSRENVLFLSPRAVVSVDGESAVYYKDENGLLALKSIETGLAAKDGIEIVNGLIEGEQVIIG